jgi:hypothetical protein
MRRYALMPLLVAIAVPTAGSAQALRQNVTPSSRDVQRGGDWYQANMRSHSNKNISSDGSSRECLIQRKTGRTVCLHRREWQEVASGKRDWNGKRVQN